MTRRTMILWRLLCQSECLCHHRVALLLPRSQCNSFVGAQKWSVRTPAHQCITPWKLTLGGLQPDRLRRYIGLKTVGATTGDARQIAAFAVQLVDQQPRYLCDVLLQLDISSANEEIATTLWEVFRAALLAVHCVVQREKRATDMPSWLR
jgi:hypothetical protein